MARSVIASPKGVAISLGDCFVASLLAKTNKGNAYYNMLPLIRAYCHCLRAKLLPIFFSALFYRRAEIRQEGYDLDPTRFAPCIPDQGGKATV